MFKKSTDSKTLKNEGGPGAWALSQLSSVASFLTQHHCLWGLLLPSIPGTRLALAVSAVPALSQFSTACTTCTFSWNPNSCAPVSCLQRRRMLSSNSVQFKITKILLPLCLRKWLLFLLTGNTLPDYPSHTQVLQPVLHITCCHHEPFLCMKARPSSRIYLDRK